MHTKPFVRYRAHRLSKSGEKLSPSHPEHSTQRFIMLENKSAERRISLYIECALNGIVSSGVGTLLQGESSDEHNYNRSSNASGSSGGTSYLGHLGLFLPWSGAAFGICV